MRNARGELKIGDYQRGCSTVSFSPDVPLDDNFFALRRSFWDEVNEAVYAAINGLDLMVVESRGTSEDEHKTFEYFSKEAPVQFYGPDQIEKLDMDFWREVLKRVSKLFIRDKIIDSRINFVCGYTKRCYINSEGTVIVDLFRDDGIEITAKTISRDNLVLESFRVFRDCFLDKMPKEEELVLAAEDLIKELEEKRIAPHEKAGEYPVIADHENHATVWHEAIAHGLEGHRSKDEDSGDKNENVVMLTFKDKIGEQIAPDFFTVYDDPTLPGLRGSYLYDEEGVKSQRVVLIENGVLKNYLHSRKTAALYGRKIGEKVKSNGHCRGCILYEPVPRTSNLVVQSQNCCSRDEMKEMFLKKCREGNRKYGLLFEGVRGGSTTGSYFQTVPLNVFRLYTNGRKERVGGIYISATPYQLLKNIIATSEDVKISTGHCGAESGDIPVAEIAPSAFIDSVEVGRIPRSDYDKHFPLLSNPPEE